MAATTFSGRIWSQKCQFAVAMTADAELSYWSLGQWNNWVYAKINTIQKCVWMTLVTRFSANWSEGKIVPENVPIFDVKNYLGFAKLFILEILRWFSCENFTKNPHQKPLKVWFFFHKIRHFLKKEQRFLKLCTFKIIVIFPRSVISVLFMTRYHLCICAHV